MNCPTPSAHRRLEDAHRSWHSALDEYQDADGFRHHINNCIQALRNTTFVIQSEHKSIPGFSEWYGEWQEKIKADSTMKWLNSARVTVVHKGDLAAKSTGHMRLISGYDDVTDETIRALPATSDAELGRNKDVVAEVEFQPFEEALGALSSANLPASVMKNSYVVVERRWVVDSLPGQELLDALAHCHGFLLNLVADAHIRTGGVHDVSAAHGETGSTEEMPFGRLPCMITTRAFRTTHFAIHDGRVDLGGRSWSLDQSEVTEGQMRRAARKYKARPTRLEKYPMHPTDWLPFYVEQGRAILASGEEHGWFVFFFRGRSVADVRRVSARDAMDKRLLSQEIAEHVAVNGYDGLLEVSEVWTAPLTIGNDGAPVTATDNPDRGEALCFYAVDANGREKSIQIPFERRRFRRKPIVGTPEVFGSQNMFYLATREVWRRKAAQASGSKEAPPTPATGD